MSETLSVEFYMVRTPRDQGIIRPYLTQQEAGMEIFTFFAAVYCISHRSSSHYRKTEKLYVVYGGILLVLVTIEVVPEALWCQYIWIDHRNYPGGPLGFYRASQSTWYGALGFAADATANILGDGLLVRSISL